MQNTLTPRLFQRVKELVSQGCESPEISKITGLSRAIIAQIRQGRYDIRRLRRRFGDAASQLEPGPSEGSSREQHNQADRDQPQEELGAEPAEEPLIVWCQRCNCHVHFPCQLCLTKAYQRDLRKYPGRRRQPAELPKDIDAETRKKLRKTVAEIGLPIRLIHTLQSAGIDNVNDLLHSTPGMLLNLPCVGNIGLQSIYRALAKLGFHRRKTDEQETEEHDTAAKKR